MIIRMDTSGDCVDKSLELVLNNCCDDMKSKLSLEVGTMRIKIEEQSKAQLRSEKERYLKELSRIRDEVLALEQLLAAHEKASSEKDDLIRRLTEALTKLKSRVESSNASTKQKIASVENKYEAILVQMAVRANKKHLLAKTFSHWRKEAIVLRAEREAKGIYEMKQAELECRYQSKQKDMEKQFKNKLEEATKTVEEYRRLALQIQKDWDSHNLNLKQAFTKSIRSSTSRSSLPSENMEPIASSSGYAAKSPPTRKLPTAHLQPKIKIISGAGAPSKPTVVRGTFEAELCGAFGS